MRGLTLFFAGPRRPTGKRTPLAAGPKHLYCRRSLWINPRENLTVHSRLSRIVCTCLNAWIDRDSALFLLAGMNSGRAASNRRGDHD